ncbi:unnamed protein product [Peronospora destructor]|uniref:Phosphatidylcholine transfer protein n=1 Tax=Peronospora destructor TaxID=86335 RepID=A0AAV0UR62_9STRA|nr:unnamed protein product [Peronospora destructor]
MSSFEVPKPTRTGTRVAALGKRPPLVHRSSDPEFSDAELDDAVDMGEDAGWANLEEPIYAEKDVEIFRPSQEGSSLPVYYAKGWLPFSADTLFNALMDARYRKSWDDAVHQLHVVEHQHVSDVMYFALNLPWPLANRDYVYRRRVEFYPRQNAFVVLYQAAHHADAPVNDTRVRVETCTLKLCIRSLPNSTDSCDFHLEYEDDTNFSIPNYVVSWLLRARMPSFMTELRKACTGYADYAKTLEDNVVQSIPSQVVRHRIEAAVAVSVPPLSMSSTTSKSALGAFVTKERKAVQASPRPQGSCFCDNKRPFCPETNSMSEEWDDHEAPRSDPPTMRSTRPYSFSLSLPVELEINKGNISHLNHSSSADFSSASFFNTPSSVAKFFRASSATSTQTASRCEFGSSTPLDDDFTINFQKQKVGLHLETDLFSSKVLVAFCEKDSEAAACTERIEPGLLVTSVNGISVSDFQFGDILSEIQRAPRPLQLGFTHPDREASFQYRCFKEPRNVLRCLVSQGEHDLLCALRPLDEDVAMGAVLKCDFAASPATVVKANFTPSSSSTSLVKLSSSEPATGPTLHSSASLPQMGRERVLVPAGYLVYEINGSYVLDVPFAETARLLRRSGDVCVVTFKAAMAIMGRSKRHSLRSKYKIPKRFSGVFRKKRNASDTSITGSNSLTSSQEWTSGKDYSTVIVTSSNIDWVWQQVLLLKATERIFSAGLLIDRLETFLSETNSTNKIIAATKARVLRAMHDERELLDHIIERRDQGVIALNEFSNKECDDKWQFGQKTLGVYTSWKPDEDGSIWIKMEGLIDGVDIFNTISVIREVDLYSVWAPFCSQSLLLEEKNHAELAAYLAITSPFLQRDTVIQAFGINAVYENRCLLLLGGSVDISSVTSSIPIPTLQGWNAGRMEIKGFRALIEPLTRMQTRTCIVVNIDPKCAIPKPMLNFGIKKMAGVLLYLIRKEAEKIQKNNKSPAISAANEHLCRIKSDPSGFYTWLRPIVDKYFVDQRNSNLPEPLSLFSNVQVEWTADTDVLCASGRTSSKTGSPRLVKQRTCTQIAALQRKHISASSVDSPERFDASALTSNRQLGDYLHDLVVWPYLVLFLFVKISAGLPLSQACALKFVFTCSCTWLGIPRSTRHWKRARHELESLRQQCVVLAAIFDVMCSWALRIWVRWVQCYLYALLQGSIAAEICLSRSPMEVRESEQFLMSLLCFLYASAIVGVQMAGNI